MRSDRKLWMAAALALACLAWLPAKAQQLTPPNIPLTFGMTPDQTAQALGVQLYYVRGRPGDELLVALPNVKGAALASAISVRRVIWNAGQPPHNLRLWES